MKLKRFKGNLFETSVDFVGDLVEPIFIPENRFEIHYERK
jgi:hypothetical protein